MNRSHYRPAWHTRGFTLVELLVVLAIISILTSMLLPGLARAMEAARRAQCSSNLRQVGMSLRMYSDEADGRYPPLQEVGREGCLNQPVPPFMFYGFAMYPEYLTDVEVLVCPSDVDGPTEFDNGRWNRERGPNELRMRASVKPCLIDDLSYSYFPWVLRERWIIDDATFDIDKNFAEGLRTELETLAKTPETSTPDWTFEDEAAEKQRVMYLRQGINRFLITDINNPSLGYRSDTSIPVMFDRVSTIVTDFNHVPGGANVLYMDGHVKFSRYPANAPYPVMRAWAEMVGGMSRQIAGDVL